MLATYLEKLPDVALLVDASDLSIRDIHRRSEAVFGYAPSALLQMRVNDIIPGCTPDLFRDYLAGRHDPHPDTPLRTMVRLSSGAEVPVDVRIAQADAHGKLLIAVVRRVSEQARIAERELVTVVCAAPLAIVTWAPDGKIVSWNPAAAALYGRPASDAIGQPIEIIVPSSERREFQADHARLLRGEPVGAREVQRLRAAPDEPDEREGEPPSIREARSAEQGQLAVDVEERLFVIRDVCKHIVRVGSFSREVTEVARLRRATEILSGTERASCESPAEEGAMRAVFAAADLAAQDNDVTVLLLGETGVGKSRLARRIHSLSPRSQRPFLEVNCAGLEPQLIESELFGHERGAFTGAIAQKRGLVEAAAGGTLFLDEVGELSIAVQAKLLTFLDNRTFRRVGGRATLHTDVRLIAATNADLESLVIAGTFRRDLYYRLRVIPISIPPLRERREDIPRLAAAIVRELRPRVPSISLSREFLQALQRYSFPGNLRELRNALERALLLARGGPVELAHLPPEVLAAAPGDPGLAGNSDQTLEAAERRHIVRTLQSTGGNRSQTAQILGISRSTLNRKVAAWDEAGLRPDNQRDRR